MAYSWAKLHCNTLDNETIGFLSDKLWRKYIELLLIAKEFDENGRLPPEKAIAWRLRISLDECNETFQELESLKLLEKHVTQTLQNSDKKKRSSNETLHFYTLVGFLESQEAEPGAKRVADHRKRAKYGTNTDKY